MQPGWPRTMRYRPKRGQEPSADFDQAWPVDARDSWPEDRRECRRFENCKSPVWGHPRKTAGLRCHRRCSERSRIARDPYPETRRSERLGILHAGWPPALFLLRFQIWLQIWLQIRLQILLSDRHSKPPTYLAGDRYTKRRAVPVYVFLDPCQRFQSFPAANGAVPTDTGVQGFGRIRPDPGPHRRSDVMASRSYAVCDYAVLIGSTDESCPQCSGSITNPYAG